MLRRTRSSHQLSPLVALGMLVTCGSLISGHCDEAVRAPEPGLTSAIAPGWTLKVVHEMPARVTSLLCIPDREQDGEFIYVGTGHTGGIYRLYEGRDTFLPAIRTIVESLADRAAFCDCEIDRLATSDLDRDGIDELVAESSQLMPRGRPRIYAFTLTEPVAIRAFARPDIESSWGHGLGFLSNPGAPNTYVLSTYCGLGEVVEYRLSRTKSPDGSVQDALGWRVLGRLPAGGEGIQVCDVDNDGSDDLFVGTGFQRNSAAILIYAAPTDGKLGEPKLVINEDNQFASVKFLAGKCGLGKSNELFVWWSTEIGEGNASLYRYRLGPDGVEARELIMSGTSEELWPIDGQMIFADLDRDGHSELWFVTPTGNVWSYSARPGASPERVCRIKAGAGPIASGGYSMQSFLYIGSDSHVLQLRRAR